MGAGVRARRPRICPCHDSRQPLARGGERCPPPQRRHNFHHKFFDQTRICSITRLSTGHLELIVYCMQILGTGTSSCHAPASSVPVVWVGSRLHEEYDDRSSEGARASRTHGGVHWCRFQPRLRCLTRHPRSQNPRLPQQQLQKRLVSKIVMTITIEAVEAMLARMMKYVAKSHDIDNLGDHTKKREENTGKAATNVNGHAAQLTGMRREVDLLNTARRTGTATATSSADSGWRPRLVHIRGCASWGSNALQKLTRKESSELQKHIDDCFREEWAHKRKRRWVASFMLLHRLRLDLLDQSKQNASPTNLT